MYTSLKRILHRNEVSTLPVQCSFFCSKRLFVEKNELNKYLLLNIRHFQTIVRLYIYVTCFNISEDFS